ncbi:MAG: ferredoxin [Deltaproteobacteria bacterium]|nr:ferredoxin [Deltaproteobacteria bacterium]MBW2070634.1 ferredoxin [Deltaproteobacteria bacterium]
MSRRVVVNENECIGCGTCEALCPEVFRLNEEKEKSEVIKAQGGPEDCIEDAIDSCPAEAISWQED